MRKIWLLLFTSIVLSELYPALLKASSASSSWTIILYMAIDNTQFGSFPTDLWGNTEKLLLKLGAKFKAKVSIILLYDGRKSGDSKIIAVHQGRVIDDADEVIPQEKEINYGAPETMVKFILWTIERYPAQHYLLGLAHHYGWKGYNTDETSPGPLQMDILTLEEHRRAMQELKARGVKIDIIWFEACSITMLETLSQYAEDADYVIGNEDTIDFYEEFTRPFLVIHQVNQNPELSPGELAGLLVEKTPLITPSLFTNQFTPYSFALNPNSPGTKPELKRLGDFWQPTQFAFSSSGVQEVNLALNQLVLYLMKNLAQLKPAIEKARKQAKEYTLYPWYIDLWDFADLLEKSSKDQTLLRLCENLKEKIERSIVAQKKPKSAKHYHGILIMFPLNRTEFEREIQNEFAPEISYFDIKFAQESLWDEFLKAYFKN